MSRPLRPLVVTGGTGFIGSRFLEIMGRDYPGPVIRLGRTDRRPAPSDDGSFVPFDLMQGRSVALPPGCVLVHLAGPTGRQAPETMERGIVQGTATLLRGAIAAGAHHVIYVSSIAAGYADVRHYPYATAKREAESLVRASGVPWTIVRPTLVFGHGSPVQRGLATLACAPVPVLFGTGDRLTQPVDVADVATVLARLAAAESATGEVLELGGGSRVTLRELWTALRAAAGRPPRDAVRLPLDAMRTLLAGVEPLLRPVMPLTAGQLALFANDSAARPAATVDALLPHPRSLGALLAPSAS